MNKNIKILILLFVISLLLPEFKVIAATAGHAQSNHYKSHKLNRKTKNSGTNWKQINFINKNNHSNSKSFNYAKDYLNKKTSSLFSQLNSSSNNDINEINYFDCYFVIEDNLSVLINYKNNQFIINNITSNNWPEISDDCEDKSDELISLNNIQSVIIKNNKYSFSISINNVSDKNNSNLQSELSSSCNFYVFRC